MSADSHASTTHASTETQPRQVALDAATAAAVRVLLGTVPASLLASVVGELSIKTWGRRSLLFDRLVLALSIGLVSLEQTLRVVDSRSGASSTEGRRLTCALLCALRCVSDPLRARVAQHLQAMGVPPCPRQTCTLADVLGAFGLDERLELPRKSGRPIGTKLPAHSGPTSVPLRASESVRAGEDGGGVFAHPGSGKGGDRSRGSRLASVPLRSKRKASAAFPPQPSQRLREDASDRHALHSGLAPVFLTSNLAAPPRPRDDPPASLSSSSSSSSSSSINSSNSSSGGGGSGASSSPAQRGLLRDGADWPLVLESPSHSPVIAEEVASAVAIAVAAAVSKGVLSTLGTLPVPSSLPASLAAGGSISTSSQSSSTRRAFKPTLHDMGLRDVSDNDPQNDAYAIQCFDADGQFIAALPRQSHLIQLVYRHAEREATSCSSPPQPSVASSAGADADAQSSLDQQPLDPLDPGPLDPRDDLEQLFQGRVAVSRFSHAHIFARVQVASARLNSPSRLRILPRPSALECVMSELFFDGECPSRHVAFMYTALCNANRYNDYFAAFHFFQFIVRRTWRDAGLTGSMSLSARRDAYAATACQVTCPSCSMTPCMTLCRPALPFMNPEALVRSYLGSEAVGDDASDSGSTGRMRRALETQLTQPEMRRHLAYMKLNGGKTLRIPTATCVVLALRMKFPGGALIEYFDGAQPVSPAIDMVLRARTVQQASPR